MTKNNMRLEAAKLARKLDAPKTLAVVNDESKNSSMSEILRTAADELGIDKLAETILASNQPAWALGAIRSLDDLGDHREALRASARVSAMSTNETSGVASLIAPEDTSKLPRIDQFEMYLSCGVGYTAWSTMWYYTPPFNNTWKQSAKQTPTKPVCQSATFKCNDYSNPSQPLQAGDVVQLIVHPSGGVDNQTGFNFVYDPSSGSTAEVDCHGTVLAANFTYSVRLT